MPRRACTITAKKRKDRAESDQRMKDAIADYRRHEDLPKSDPKKISIRRIAKLHKVDRTTLGRLLNGGMSMSEFNALKCHLTEAEERVLLSWTVDQAKHGFPLTHRLLEQRANAILQLRNGPDFEVGRMWISRFLERREQELSVYWSRPLDRSRASGLNPVAVGWYFDTLEGLDQKYRIPTENWYAADETGIALGLAAKMMVIGPAGESVQHKQQEGDRQIVTVMETICADGTFLRPTVIFKGKNLLQKWGRYNPCEASIGVGPNGYMDTALAVEYLCNFDKQTKGKNNAPRVLMLDGHVSHCSLAFLDLAASLNIFVVSYPPHTTHRLQGRDVVIFAVLKHHWQLLRDVRERATGLPLKKEDFLALYASARTATLTPSLIIQAFRKTGAHPINRNVVSEDEMLPSRETSNQVVFPAHLASPVKAVLAAHRITVTASDHSAATEAPGPSVGRQATQERESTHPISPFDPSRITPEQRAQAMNFMLRKTSASFLVDKTAALTDGQAIPAPVFERPDKELTPDWSLLTQPIPTDPNALRGHFQLALTALGRSKAHSGVVESCLEASNAQLVLAHLEVARLTAAIKELKGKGKGKNSRAKLMASGDARLLTSEGFRDALRKDAAAADAKAAKKIANKQARTLAAKRVVWRREAIDSNKKKQAAQLEEWERMCQVAKQAKRRAPAKPKATKRAKTPDDAFFASDESDESDEELELESDETEDEE